ncbi:MAG TPA: PP2C family serine/threonine-protein phosphatase [Streptosporangiaceae bacterium]|jgi:protein phosphatase
MTLALRYAVRSDVGLLREGNEDSAYAGPHLLAIADGMGGHAAGEVASAVAISALAGLDDDVPGIDMLGALADAVAKANARLHDMSAADPSVEGMGTTLTAMLWSGPRMALCHIGDSRGYMLRDRDFYQITRDHTLVQSLLDEGRISAEEAANHPQRSLILRALDSRTDAEPDLSLREVLAGDRYLLCSDGLSDVVTEETLHRALLAIDDPGEAVVQLVDLANRGGGPDNITCIVADVIDSATALRPPTEVSVVAGAASNQGGRPVPRADTPATRAHLLTQPQRAPAAGFDGQGPRGGLDDGGDQGPGHTSRRWPIVTTILVVLVLVVVGGGFAAWTYTQHQYFVGESSGQIAIFRGINQKLAGISMSSVYKRTGIPIGQVTTDDRQQITATITASSLADANKIVTSIRSGAATCQQDFAAQQRYTSAQQTYTQQLSAYQAAKRKHRSKAGKPPVAPVKPASLPTNCPQASGTPSSSGGTPSPGSSGSSSPSSSSAHPSTPATTPSTGGASKSSGGGGSTP